MNLGRVLSKCQPFEGVESSVALFTTRISPAFRALFTVRPHRPRSPPVHLLCISRFPRGNLECQCLPTVPDRLISKCYLVSSVRDITRNIISSLIKSIQRYCIRAVKFELKVTITSFYSSATDIEWSDASTLGKERTNRSKRALTLSLAY